MTLTKNPEPYGHYEGWSFPDSDGRVWAVGRTPGEAIVALAEARGWGELNCEVEVELVGGDEGFSWGARFCAGGISFKVVGHHVPGGVVVTRWV